MEQQHQIRDLSRFLMDSSGILILGIALLILICFVVFSLEMYLPLHMKIEMISVIRPYMFKLEGRGSLSSVDQLSLKTDLEGVGLDDLNIIMDYQGNGFGDWIDVEITGYHDRVSMVALFERARERLHFTYHKKIFIRHIEN